jgi:hypothetical protein
VITNPLPLTYLSNHFLKILSLNIVALGILNMSFEGSIQIIAGGKAWLGLINHFSLSGIKGLPGI